MIAIPILQQAIIGLDNRQAAALLLALLTTAAGFFIYFATRSALRALRLISSWYNAPPRICRREGHLYTDISRSLNAAMTTLSFTLRCSRCDKELHWTSTDLSLGKEPK